MRLEILSPERLEAVYEMDLKEAFPPAELKPLSAMESMRAKGVYEPLALRDGDDHDLGYILLWKHADGRFILIDYLCVPASRRNTGIGGQLLRAVRAIYPPQAVFIAEAEAPTGDPARDGLILRRLGFYRRHGAAALGYDTALFGVHYKTLCWADCPPDEAVVLRRHQEIYLQQFGPEKYARYIQIPLAAGEAVRPVSDWRE